MIEREKERAEKNKAGCAQSRGKYAFMCNNGKIEFPCHDCSLQTNLMNKYLVWYRKYWEPAIACIYRYIKLPKISMLLLYLFVLLHEWTD